MNPRTTGILLIIAAALGLSDDGYCVSGSIRPTNAWPKDECRWSGLYLVSFSIKNEL